MGEREIFEEDDVIVVTCDRCEQEIGRKDHHHAPITVTKAFIEFMDHRFCLTTRIPGVSCLENWLHDNSFADLYKVGVRK